MEFTVSKDRMATVVTIVVTIICIGSSALPFFTAAGSKDAGTWVMYGTAAFLLLTLLFAWLLRPTGYGITENQLILHRPIRSREIALSDITSIRVPEPRKMRWSIRLFGSGGLFGYFGKFRNSTFGTMNWYATRLGKFVVIILRSGEKFVVTPDDESFAAHLRSAAGLSEQS
ncbi:MAG: PH domain-containing protein [Bacteroidota bacterium]